MEAGGETARPTRLDGVPAWALGAAVAAVIAAVLVIPVHWLCRALLAHGRDDARARFIKSERANLVAVVLVRRPVGTQGQRHLRGGREVGMAAAEEQEERVVADVEHRSGGVAGASYDAVEHRALPLGGAGDADERRRRDVADAPDDELRHVVVRGQRCALAVNRRQLAEQEHRSHGNERQSVAGRRR